MGRTHCLSGAASWLAGCSALVVAGHPARPAVAFAGAVVAAGAALLPDIDRPDATISWSAGRVTRRVAAHVAAGAAWLQAATCGHCARRGPGDGHRAVTHTLAFAVGAGAVVAGAAWIGGGWVTLPLLWAAAALTARCLLSRRQRGASGAPLLASLVTVSAAVSTEVEWWWLGLSVAWGTLAHTLGDSMTGCGVPLCWPMRIRGCRWVRVGPRRARFAVGGRMEGAVWVLLVLSSVAGCGFLLAST